MRKIYLGDGCYAEITESAVILTMDDGYQVTNTIYLEPDVLHALILFAERERFISLPKKEERC